MSSQPRLRQWFIAGIALAGWFSVVFQLYLILLNRQASVGETLVRFFSFFTILSNLLTAICFSFLMLAPGSSQGRFFSRPQNLTAITVYMVMVGLVYNTTLRFLWAPQGSQKLVDELLHVVMPLLTLLFWIFFVPKTSIAPKMIFRWLIYPVAYLAYALLRGAMSGYYPYPFVNVTQLGYPTVFLNSLLLILLFLLISLLFVWLGKRKKTSSYTI
jgi:hypothetical protein